MKTQFGNILLRRRKELSFTQEYIAKVLHLSAQAISKWERGGGVPIVKDTTTKSTLTLLPNKIILEVNPYEMPYILRI